MKQLMHLRTNVEIRGDPTGYINDAYGFRHTEEPAAPTLRDRAGVTYSKRTQIKEFTNDLRPPFNGSK
jgi:hypothetical protein